MLVQALSNSSESFLNFRLRPLRIRFMVEHKNWYFRRFPDNAASNVEVITRNFSCKQCKSFNLIEYISSSSSESSKSKSDLSCSSHFFWLLANEVCSSSSDSSISKSDISCSSHFSWLFDIEIGSISLELLLFAT